MDAEQIRSIDVITGQINAIPGVADPGDKGLNVVFKMHSHFDDAKTREMGRPIFEMKEYIMITIPGDITGNVFRPAFQWDKERFPEQYLRFKAGQEQVHGTPLSTWSQITPAQVDELAFFKIQTLEQLASVSDGNAQKFLGLAQLRDKAKRYMEDLATEAPLLKVQAELSERDEKLAVQANQIAQLQAIVEQLMAEREERKKPKTKEE